MLGRFIRFIVGITIATGCSTPEAPRDNMQTATKGTREDSASQVVVMAFNVENLFDTKDDPGKTDETFLPLTLKSQDKYRKACASVSNPYYRKSCYKKDWNDEKLKLKMKRIAQVILSTNGGKGPDILILEEVENRTVLETLRTQYLGVADYKPSILLEGPDKRGIDVGILSRLPSANPPKLHHVRLRPGNGLKASAIHPTRGILHATLELPDQTRLHVLGVHFPSQRSPSEARIQAINTLNAVQKQIPKEDLVIAGGDFNITNAEDASKKLYKSLLGSQWAISHEVGCDQCVGTHNYRGKWSFLDALLFSSNLRTPSSSDWKVDRASIRVVNTLPIQNQKKRTGLIPARFHGGKGSKGVSDHWPLEATIYKASTRKN